jgi:hypothetical protein
MIEGDDLALFQRSLAHATEEHSGAALDASLDALGWRDALDLDPRAAIATLFTLQGAANVTSGSLDVALADLLLEADAEAVPEAVAVILPRLGLGDPPAVLAGEQLRVDGIGTAALVRHDTAVVGAALGGETVAVVVETGALTVRPFGGLDPALGLVEVRAEMVLPAGSVVEQVSWPESIARGRLALSHELIGGSRTMLELARTHALDRVQFGVPVSSFQAVRHRLAEALVAIEAAEAAVDGAWLDGTLGAAAIAKAVAGRSARTVARHAQQVLAGVGFTTEHPFHQHLRRALVLDGLLGDARTLTRRLGAELLAARSLPSILPL